MNQRTMHVEIDVRSGEEIVLENANDERYGGKLYVLNTVIGLDDGLNIRLWVDHNGVDLGVTLEVWNGDLVALVYTEDDPEEPQRIVIVKDYAPEAKLPEDY